MSEISNNTTLASNGASLLTSTATIFKLDSVLSEGAVNISAEQACHDSYGNTQGSVTQHSGRLQTLAQEVNSISNTLTEADAEVKAKNK